MKAVALHFADPALGFAVSLDEEMWSQMTMAGCSAMPYIWQSEWADGVRTTGPYLMRENRRQLKISDHTCRAIFEAKSRAQGIHVDLRGATGIELTRSFGTVMNIPSHFPFTHKNPK